MSIVSLAVSVTYFLFFLRYVTYLLLSLSSCFIPVKLICCIGYGTYLFLLITSSERTNFLASLQLLFYIENS
jgi:hypothetical protein